MVRTQDFTSVVPGSIPTKRIGERVGNREKTRDRERERERETVRKRESESERGRGRERVVVIDKQQGRERQ